jgi:hypothetical protein
MTFVTNFDDPSVINPFLFLHHIFVLLLFIARSVLYFYGAIFHGYLMHHGTRHAEQRDCFFGGFKMEETLCWVMQSSVSGADKQAAMSSG